MMRLFFLVSSVLFLEPYDFPPGFLLRLRPSRRSSPVTQSGSDDLSSCCTLDYPPPVAYTKSDGLRSHSSDTLSSLPIARSGQYPPRPLAFFPLPATTLFSNPPFSFCLPLRGSYPISALHSPTRPFLRLNLIHLRESVPLSYPSLRP